MWINPMLTIWLYGTIFSLALIMFTLWLWYWRAPYDDSPEHTDDRTDHGA